MRILRLPIEPTRLPRLDEVQADITKRIDTVRTQQWRVDIDQLPTTLIHIEAKPDETPHPPGPALVIPIPDS
ncbi:hypothetical protein [Nocardia sp. NBC_00403]|uniref:hypothetical protein n=1 Tax=Nocardia sp. NBC_00403 TaxID=2975990 RepID=UPI002E1C73FC